MSRYRITLEGKTYEMDVELISESSAVQPALHREAKAAETAPKKETEPAAAPTVPRSDMDGAGTVTAPMPGTVIRIAKGEGEIVKAGELVLILEAMKMENEIFSPEDGTIAAMNCAEGSTVATGDILFAVK